MSEPAGPVAYTQLSLNVYDGSQVTLAAWGCVMNPDGTLQVMGHGLTFAVEIPLAYGASAADVRAAVGQAIAAGYGGTAPDVVLLPSF